MSEQNGHLILSPAQTEEVVGAELLFGVLARILLVHPERGFVEQLAAERLFADIPMTVDTEKGEEGAALLAQWCNENRDHIEEETFSTIASDYTRLFEGPGHVEAPPWESVHLNVTGLTFQKETLAVRHWYHRFGLESVKLNNEPDDHVGLELSFLAFLLGKTLAASSPDGASDAARYLQAQEQFLAEHLGRWIDRWAELVDRHAKTSFWRGIALLAAGAVSTWQQFLATAAPEIQTP
jgi:TorA maturation chaperone TorD